MRWHTCLLCLSQLRFKGRRELDVRLMVFLRGKENAHRKPLSLVLLSSSKAQIWEGGILSEQSLSLLYGCYSVSQE